MPISLCEDFSSVVFRANVHVLRFKYPREHMWQNPAAYEIVGDIYSRLNSVLERSCRRDTGLLSSWQVDKNLHAAMPKIREWAQRLYSMGLEIEVDAYDCPQGSGLIGLKLEVHKLPDMPCATLEHAS